MRTQQAFLNALQARARFDAALAPFETWLTVIARNHAMLRAIKLQRVRLVGDQEISRRREAAQSRGGDGVDDSIDWPLAREIRRLTHVQRQVLIMHTVLGLGYQEIATRLGRSEESIRAQHSRAIRILRSRLIAQADEEVRSSGGGATDTLELGAWTAGEQGRRQPRAPATQVRSDQWRRRIARRSTTASSS